MTDFTTKERKKEFDRIFKESILPFFEENGFSRHTKTSKRLFKEFGNGLTVFLFFEYKSRFGFYDLSIAYFDDDIGTMYDDEYLALPKIKMRGFSGENSVNLDLAADQWLTQLKSTVIPFLKEYSSHKAILSALDNFEISRGRETACLEVLRRKA